jgi:hypothetical protein
MADGDGSRRPAKPLTPVQRRLIEPLDQDDQALSFMHAVLCQVGLPYRDPGADVRLWQRRQGSALLEVQAGRLFDPRRQDMVDVGLPWGPKPRLILAHLNAEALRQRSPEIEVEASLTAFVQRVRGFKHGREIRAFKEQLSRLSASLVRLAVARSDHHAHQVETKVISSFDLWLQKDERQRVLWPSTIRLSRDYFESLQKHAVPLNEADLGALAHSAMTLDIYCWLAHRLHRVDPHKPVFIPWTALKDQFGRDYGRVRDFKAFFRAALRAVLTRYQDARVELDDQGMTACFSAPPVRGRYGFIRGAKPQG